MPKASSGSSPSQISQTQKIRRKQIEKLRQLKLNITTIHGDVQYKIDFTLKQGTNQMGYSIIVDLPPAFPSEAPMLFIQPPCSHKYLDAAQVVVNFPPLENFKSKQDLASVVKRLINEFEKSPPIPLVLNEYETQQQEDMLRSYTGASQYPNLDDTLPVLKNVGEISSTPENKGLKLPESIPELDDLTMDELKDLDSNEMQFLGVFHSTEMAKKITVEREEISKRIENVANENLSESEQLENCRSRLVKGLDKCRKLREDYHTNVKRLNEASEWISLHNLSLTLQVAAAEQEQTAEKMVEIFLEGEMDVADFTKEFVKTKTLAATRKAQEDKIQHILTSQ